MSVNMILNEEQQKLVADNHALIMWYAEKHNLDIDTWYDVLAIALCKAAFYYSADDATFSTFASRGMDYAVWEELRARGRRIEGAADMLSLDFEYCDNDDGNYVLGDLIADERTNTENCVEIKNIIDNCKASLKEKERRIVDLILLGYKQKEVASRYGVSRARINQVVNKFRTQYHKQAN